MKAFSLMFILLSLFQANAMIYDYFAGEEITLFEAGAVLKVQAQVDGTYKNGNREYIILRSIREVYDPKQHRLASGSDLEGLCQHIGFTSHSKKRTISKRTKELLLKIDKQTITQAYQRGITSSLKMKFIKRHKRYITQLTCWRES